MTRDFSKMKKCGRWTPKGPCKLPQNHGFAHDGVYGPEVNYGGFPYPEGHDDYNFDDDFPEDD